MTFDRELRTILRLACLSLTVVACDAGEDGGDDDSCDGAKCDKPGGTQSQQCEQRQSEVLSSSNRGFTETAIRWSCADVEGVNTVGQDNRGQEYCEYYAIFQPPGDAESYDLGRNLSENEGEVTANRVCVGESGDDCRVTITDDQFGQLEDDPSAVVGACLFTSWHADVPGPLPVCADGCGTSAKVFTLPLTEEFARMKIFFNQNGAAADLVSQCITGEPPQPSDWSNADDPLTEPFYRGCMQVQGIFQTGWRRSDPSVCAVANRLEECGCSIPGVTDLARAIVPPQPDASGNITLRGFRLGTWDNAEGPPPGCRYVDTGDTSHTLVACDLTAADVMQNLNDPKEVCRRTYGPNVVVHVPIAADAITCNPPDTPEAAGCGAIPWNIGAEGERGSGGETGDTGDGDTSGGEECCKVCATSKPCGDACIPMSSTCNLPAGCACSG